MQQPQKTPEVFGIFAEAEDFGQPLIMLGLSFGRLLDEIVLPYQEDGAFFVDGVPLKRKNLRKLKILRMRSTFESEFWVFNQRLKGEEKSARVFGDQYSVRLEALFRENADDVTAQVITAFDRTIKPSLKDYLPKREELIQGALKFFLQNLTQLAGAS